MQDDELQGKSNEEIVAEHAEWKRKWTLDLQRRQRQHERKKRLLPFLWMITIAAVVGYLWFFWPDIAEEMVRWGRTWERWSSAPRPPVSVSVEEVFPWDVRTPATLLPNDCRLLRISDSERRVQYVAVCR